MGTGVYGSCGMTHSTSVLSKIYYSTLKLKHTNSILEYFEYICQMSSKSIPVISSYTFSKLARFLRHSVELFSLEQIAATTDNWK